ncbi:hypothetical protein OKW38_006057 [Paraburkholderia sp. MM5496-R1]
MPEKFGFEQIFRNRAAVHRNERLVRTRAIRVNHFRHQLLAGAAFSIDQHRQIGWRRFFRDFERFEQTRVVAERALENEAAFE